MTKAGTKILVAMEGETYIHSFLGVLSCIDHQHPEYYTQLPVSRAHATNTMSGCWLFNVSKQLCPSTFPLALLTRNGSQ